MNGNAATLDPVQQSINAAIWFHKTPGSFADNPEQGAHSAIVSSRGALH
jgi:hypothetical protein